jgi:phosphate/sulfate permease
MPESLENKPAPRSAVMRVVTFTTGTIVSFSFTLLAASLALFAGLVPLEKLSLGQRLDIGAMLFIAPVLALVLAVVFEAARLALARDWQPDRRDG